MPGVETFFATARGGAGDNPRRTGGLAPLRVRRLQRVALHVDLTMLARLAQARREDAARAVSESRLESSEDHRTVPHGLYQKSEDYGGLPESILEPADELLRSISPADCETSDVEEGLYEMVYMVEDGENWRARYDSLEAFYAAHEERHPEIRHYAARSRKFLDDREEVLRAKSPADFETTPYAAVDCLVAAYAIGAQRGAS